MGFDAPDEKLVRLAAKELQELRNRMASLSGVDLAKRLAKAQVANTSLFFWCSSSLRLFASLRLWHLLTRWNFFLG